jgi:hypothetical protein
MFADCLPDCLLTRCRPPRGQRRVQQRPGMKAMYFKRKKQCCRPLAKRRHRPDGPRYYRCCFFTFLDIRIPAWICGVLLLCAALNLGGAESASPLHSNLSSSFGVAFSQPQESQYFNHLPLCTASMATFATGSCLPLYCRTRDLASDLCLNKVWDKPHTAGDLNSLSVQKIPLRRSVRTGVCGPGLTPIVMDSPVGLPLAS